MFPDEQFRLTRQATFALLISSAFPGVTYAVAVARVDFAIGDVSATGLDGQSRPVAKGTEINQGDTLNTGANGRVQVRFTDGAYTSIQPTSQFRVDEYRYVGKADGSEKGFFSLLKGGLRTITGAIGKVNQRTYQVYTPTATIGIRGTEYLAKLGNSLNVSVGEGAISLTNNAGELVIQQGQSAYVADANSLPVITFEKPTLPPEGAKQGQTTQQQGIAPTEKPVVPPPTDRLPPKQQPNQVIEELTGGIPTPTTTVQLPSGSGYAVAVSGGFGASPVNSIECVPSCAQGQSTVTFGSTGATRFEQTSCPTCDFIGLLSNGTVVGSSDGGVIAWGQWTSGLLTAGGFFNNQTILSGQGLHYVVGIPTPAMPTSGSATYNMIGATTPSFSDGVGGGVGTGQVTSASLSVNFGATFLDLRGNMDLSFTGPSGVSNYATNFSSLSGFSGAQFNAFGTTSKTGGPVNVCGSFGCSTRVLGLFAGANASHAGYAYQISTSSSFVINGAVATKR